MENNKTLFTVFALIVGLALGYIIGISGTNKYRAGIHMMPNGQMMSNNGTGGMSGMMDDMMVGLGGKTGDAFDKTFLSEMIIHHQGAVLMAQSALKNAKHQEIKDLSQNIITAQNKEIAEMQRWYKDWYNQ